MALQKRHRQIIADVVAIQSFSSTKTVGMLYADVRIAVVIFWKVEIPGSPV